jgi:hypothetical protein
MQFISYDSMGRILFYRTMAAEDVELYPNENLIAVDTNYSDKTYMIKDGQIEPRPTMPLTVTGSIISGIPQGATVTLGEQSFVVDDGEADIEGYTGVVKIKCWPYLDAEVTL